MRTPLTKVAILVVTLFTLAAASAGAATAPARTFQAANQLESQVLSELNAVRRAHGLVPLKLSRPLASAADVHSRSMGTHGFFSHDSKDGSDFSRRVMRFYESKNYRSWSVGENLLWSTTGIDARGALKLWMESPSHRKNILTARWREVGLSALTVPAAPGVFGGRDVVIVTSDFGVRS
ncbi:MAG: CAP domain-containing protein [Actinomycetota bacterium]|nr:CAP domain-containing protein [Actinomycetota bacterium]